MGSDDIDDVLAQIEELMVLLQGTPYEEQAIFLGHQYREALIFAYRSLKPYMESPYCEIMLPYIQGAADSCRRMMRLAQVLHPEKFVEAFPKYSTTPRVKEEHADIERLLRGIFDNYQNDN